MILNTQNVKNTLGKWMQDRKIEDWADIDNFDTLELAAHLILDNPELLRELGMEFKEPLSKSLGKMILYPHNELNKEDFLLTLYGDVIVEVEEYLMDVFNQLKEEMSVDEMASHYVDEEWMLDSYHRAEDMRLTR